MKFRDYLIAEDFDQTKAVKDALEWMTKKYGKDRFAFRHIEGMQVRGANTKTYDITINDDVYMLNLRKFDSNGDGNSDTIGFDIESVSPEAEPEQEPEL